MVYGSGTGSICYDQGLDEHRPQLAHSKITQKSRKTAFQAEIFFACGAPKKEGGLAALAERDPPLPRAPPSPLRRSSIPRASVPSAPPAQRLAPTERAPTHDRDAPEPRDASPSPTSQPVTIERLGGPTSRAAQAYWSK